MALRLLYQENPVSDPTQIQTKRIVANNVAYQTASTLAASGYPTISATYITVAVTQRYHRLYAVATLVYLQVFTQPIGGGSTPTATPDTGDGNGFAPAPRDSAGGSGSDAAALPAALPTVLPMGMAGLPRERAEDTPVPLPTDHFRGNLCSTPGDTVLAILDRNCASEVETRALLAIESSLAFDPHARDDARPAASVGVDGFAVSADASQGYRMEYPAQWTPASVPGTTGAVRSTDQNVLVTLTVQRTDADSLAQSDLQSVADQQIAQLSSVAASNVSYRTARSNGILFLLAYSPLTSITTASGGTGSGEVSMLVAAYHHRVYSVRGVALKSDLGDSTPVLYPYFSPFTALARAFAIALDTHEQEANLTLQTTETLFIDLHVQAPR